MLQHCCSCFSDLVWWQKKMTWLFLYLNVNNCKNKVTKKNDNDWSLWYSKNKLLNKSVCFQGDRGHIRVCEAIRSIAMATNLKRPDLTTSRALRKYMATVAQVLIFCWKQSDFAQSHTINFESVSNISCDIRFHNFVIHEWILN